MISILKKLKQGSLDEFRVRGLQAAHIYAERQSWSSQSRLVADDTFLNLLDRDRLTFAPSGPLASPLEYRDYFRSRTEPAFFSSFSNPDSTVTEFRRRWPEAEARLITQADRILSGHFELLGLQDVSFGEPVDWHLEPISGKRAPIVHWSRLNFLDANVAGDKKIIWELNRHQYLVTLGQAYWLTGDEKYAAVFADHINSFCAQNPPKLGINWASSLEVAFRSISWIWALHFFKTSNSLSPELFLLITKFLYANARHLETYLSTYFSPNTHLTGEALGLFYIGTMLPEFKESERWRNTGLRILTEQLEKHVKSDGVYFEQSTYYHRYTTDFYLHLWILLQVNNQAAPATLQNKLALLLDHLMLVTRPDGKTPLLGDDDGGRLVKLDGRDADDFRATLCTGAALFKQPAYKYVAGDLAEETLWLLGPDSLKTLDSLQAHEPATQSAAFGAGGYYVMRDGWSPSSNYLIFDCGPHGVHNGGHAHADALSFELAANGRTLLVDPGTFTYTGSKQLRDWFRSSLAHNVLTVDGLSSSVTDGPFSWKSSATAVASAWFTSARFDYVEGSHDGYQRLQAPVTHNRSLLFLRNDYWIMRDRLDSDSEHGYQLLFHLDPAVYGQIDSEHELVIHESPEVDELRIWVSAANGRWHREEGAVSRCYGAKQPAAYYTFSVKAASEELITFLLPRPSSGVGAESGEWVVREVETIGGRAFEVISQRTVDLLMIRTQPRVETARLASDFKWTWARFSKEGEPMPEELVLIDGQSLELEGKKILKSDRRINYLSATQKGDRFRVEADERVADCNFPVTDLEAVLSSR